MGRITIRSIRRRNRNLLRIVNTFTSIGGIVIGVGGTTKQSNYLMLVRRKDIEQWLGRPLEKTEWSRIKREILLSDIWQIVSDTITRNLNVK